MKVSERIQHKIEDIYHTQSVIYLVEFETFFNLLEKENIDIDEFCKIWQALKTEMERRHTENVRLSAYRLKPLPDFDFNEWIKTIK